MMRKFAPAAGSAAVGVGAALVANVHSTYEWFGILAAAVAVGAGVTSAIKGLVSFGASLYALNATLKKMPGLEVQVSRIGTKFFVLETRFDWLVHKLDLVEPGGRQTAESLRKTAFPEPQSTQGTSPLEETA